MMMIAVLVPFSDKPIFSGAIKGIERVAKQNGYSVIVFNTEDNPEEEKVNIHKLNNMLVDGFICAPFNPDDDYWVQLGNSGTIFVHMVRCSDSNKINSIGADYYKAAYDATNVLISRGCRNIYSINGLFNVKPFQKRYEGFCAALSKAGFSDVENRVELTSENTYELGYDAVYKLMKSGEKPDGLVMVSDAQTMGALRAIKELGLKIPDDIKIINCSGHGISHMLETRVSVVEVSGERIGAAAMERLLEIILNNGNIESQQTIIESELFLREST